MIIFFSSFAFQKYPFCLHAMTNINTGIVESEIILFPPSHENTCTCNIFPLSLTCFGDFKKVNLIKKKWKLKINLMVFVFNLEKKVETVIF